MTAILLLLVAPVPVPTMTEKFIVGSWEMLWEESSPSVIQFNTDGSVNGYLISPEWGFKGSWHFDRGQLKLMVRYNGDVDTPWGFHATKSVVHSLDSFTVEQYSPFTESRLRVDFKRIK